MTALQQRLDSSLHKVDEVLRRSVEGTSVLGDVGTGLIESGGKRVRPELLITSYLAGGGEDADTTVDIAAAFELIHTASLIHDDITDDPTLRRRRPAPQRRYGLSRALVAGDYLFARAFGLLVAQNERVSGTIADAAIAMAEGEHLELVRSFDADVTMDQYMEIIEKKTASLFVAAARTGSMLAGSDQEAVDTLGTYASHVGLAFQMVDDVLDFEPSAALTGKPGGMDLREGRINSVLLAAFERLEDAEREDVVRIFEAPSPPQNDVERAVALVRGTGAGGIAMERAQHQVEVAVETLGDLFDGDAMEALVGIAMEVVRRRS